MNEKFQTFRSSVIGQFIEKEDAKNYAQCLDLIFAWCDYLSIPRETVRHLHAYEIWTKASDLTKQYFDLIPNTATNIAVVGDILVFDTKVGIDGHTSLETGYSNSKNALTLDQNWGSPRSVREVTHLNYLGVIGWLHPKTQTVQDPKVVLAQIRTILYSSATPQEKQDQYYKLLP